MTRVLATGTFDLLHPGHLHYLSESAKLGDELWVIVARRSMINHKRPPLLPGEQRRKVVEALDVVHRAVLGSENSMFDPLREIQPEIITIGHDQYHTCSELQRELREQGFDVTVTRIDEAKPHTERSIYSTRDMIERASTYEGHVSLDEREPRIPEFFGLARGGYDIPDSKHERDQGVEGHQPY